MKQRSNEQVPLTTPPSGGVESARPLEQSESGLGVTRTAEGIGLSGEIDAATWTTLSNALRELVTGAVEREEVIVDLSGISFVDVGGARMIVMAARKLGAARRMVLRGAPWGMLRIAEVLRLEERETGLVIEGHAGGEHG